jgi:hypothetical protein
MSSNELATFGDTDIVGAEGSAMDLAAALAMMPVEDQQELSSCVAEWRSSSRRLLVELFNMTEQLARMRKILGDQFYPFAIQRLGVARKTVYRYMHINSVLHAHFEVDGKVVFSNGEEITQRALLLLSPTTDDTIMVQIKSALTEGQPIDERMVSNLLAQKDADHAASLAGAQAEAERTAKTMSRKLERVDAELARSQREMNAQAELLRRTQETQALLQKENDELRKSSTEVRFEEKNVEVVPPGYATAAEAIQAKEKALQQLQRDESAIQANIVSLQEQQTQLKAKLADAAKNTADFQTLKTVVETAIAQFPYQAQLAIAKQDVATQQALCALGHTMIQFGEQLTKEST